MKFRINRDDCFSREEEKGTVSLIVRKNNQILYLNESGARVLDYPGQWVDLDAFVDGLDIEDAPREKVREDYENLLFKLNAYGLAEIEGIERAAATGCRFADRRDCAALSEFFLKNVAEGYSCAVSANPAYYGVGGVYLRMTSGGEMTVVDETEGRIDAAFVLRWPNRAAGFTALSLESAVFDAGMAEGACAGALGRAIEQIKSALGGQCCKIRYRYMNRRQDWLTSELRKLGFLQTARFEREALSGRDITFYDLFFD